MSEGSDVRRALDILEIQGVISLYSLGQDNHQSDNNILQEWDSAFAPDGTTDYSVAGAPLCHYKELAHWMRGSAGEAGRMSRYAGWQHLLSIPIIRVSGDTAHSRTDFLAIHKLRSADAGPGERFDASGAFHDDLIRTSSGWRIKHRRLEVYFGVGFETKNQMAVASAPQR
jgi:hypothetical protein